MTAPVRIEAEAWGDLRFATLARLCGFSDLEHALIKCARIWSWQTENFTFEEPTYVVDQDTIESALGEGGAAALTRARLAEEVPEGFRIKGSVGRIEWLAKLRTNSVKGGEANKRRLNHKDEPRGYPRGQPSDSREASQEDSPLIPALTPALTPALALSPDQQRSQIDRSARARDPRTGWQRRHAWWGAMLESHRRLRDLGIEPNAPDLPPSAAGEHERNLVKCENGLVEGGFAPDVVDEKMRHAIAIAFAEADRDQSLKYFKPSSIFAPANFNRLVDTTLAQVNHFRQRDARAGPRSGPIGPATPRNDHPTGEAIPFLDALEQTK